MPEMSNNGRPWWESQLDWSLPDSMRDTWRFGRRMVRNIPATLSAYKLGKDSHVDSIEPDPVEKIGTPKRAAAQTDLAKVAELITQKSEEMTVIERMAPVAVPTPANETMAPAAVSTRAISAPVSKAAALPLPAMPKDRRKAKGDEQETPPAPKKKVTLELLLDPDYTDY